MGKDKKSRRKPGARSYANYSKEMLNVAIDLVRCKKLSSYEAEKQFGIPRRTILNGCKNLHDKSVGRPTNLTEVEEKHIAGVINVAAEFGCPLTLLDLRIVVHNYLEKNDRLNVFGGKLPGERWARTFLERHKFSQRATQNIKRCRAAKSVPEMINFYKNLETSLENIPPSNILNFDETNLSDDPGASKAIFKRGTKHPERVINSTKTSISIMFAVTANGHCLPPYVVYKSEHLWTRWCRNGPPNARYNRTSSGWFDMTMFDDYFEFMVLPWADSLAGPKLVIGDNLSSHISVNTIQLCQEHNIRFVFLPRNATHLTQPLDLAFFGPMKREWRKILLRYKLSNAYVCTINKCHFPELLNELMQKISMNSENNIKSGFAAAGIYPFNPSKVIDKIPEVTEEKQQTFDTTLLEYLQVNRQGKPLNKGKNQKLEITAGKSVSTEEAEKMSRKVKVTKKRTKNVTSIDLDEIISDLPKVKLLSSARFDKENIAFTEKNDLFDITTSNRSPTNCLSNDVVTNVNVHGNLSTDEEKRNTPNFAGNIKTQKKKKLVKRKKKIGGKKNLKKNKMRRSSSTTSVSDLISIHSDSDLLDVAFYADSWSLSETNCEDEENIKQVTEEPLEKIMLSDDDKDIKKSTIVKTKQNIEITENKVDVELFETDNADGVQQEEIHEIKQKFRNSLDESNIDLVRNTELDCIPTPSPESSKFKIFVNDYVLVRYYKNKTWKYYIGVVTACNDDNSYNVSFYTTFRNKGQLKFKRSRKNDRDTVTEVSIVKTIEIRKISDKPEEYVLCHEEDEANYF